jgi:N-acetyl-anhydromuramyl-L-alanine amidase AmpD
MSDFAGATFFQSPNFWSSRFGYRPKWIIVHGTAGGGSAQNIATRFSTAASGVSAHYIVDLDGSVIQCVDEEDSAWSNGTITDSATTKHDPWWTINPNFETIAIEHVKRDTANASALTTAQQTTSFKLIKDICGRHTIPMRSADRSGGITGHFSMDPRDRAHCPGLYPWEALWTYLKETSMITITNPIIARYFVLSADNEWRCKLTGFLIRGALLAAYQTIGGIALCGLTELGLPLSNEYPGEKLGTAEQRFERGILVYDPGHVLDGPPGSGACYLKHLNDLYQLPGQLTSAAEQIAKGTATIASLTAQLDAEKKRTAQLTLDLQRTVTIPVSPPAEKPAFDAIIAALQSVEQRVEHLEGPAAPTALVQSITLSPPEKTGPEIPPTK